MTTVPLDPVATEAPVEVIRRIGAQPIPSIGANSAALLLRLVDLLLQLRSAGVDELELRELGVEHSDDLRKLVNVSMTVCSTGAKMIRTGSSGLPVLLSV